MEVVEHVEILLVEDNPLDAELTMRGLKEEKLANKITWVKDGQQALDYLYRQGAYTGRDDVEPRLMPRVDGIEVLKVIKTDDRTRRIPVAIMTSSQEESDVVKSYDLGANSYIVKPIDFNMLAAVAQQAGFYWLAVNRAAPR